jgi:hypothetical protein
VENDLALGAELEALLLLGAEVDADADADVDTELEAMAKSEVDSRGTRGLSWRDSISMVLNRQLKSYTSELGT